VRRTWAPRGHTPSHHRGDRHARLSVTGAIPVSPCQKRLGLYFSMAQGHVTGDALCTFVQQLPSRLKRPLLLIGERCRGHKQAARLLRDIYGHRSHVAFLPAYAPALNVVAQAWGHTTYGDMANFIPYDGDDLAQEVARALLMKQGRPDLRKAFFQHARLDL